MDRQLAERMVGAAVLLTALVIVVPSIFDADHSPPAADPAESDGSLDIRTHTIHLDGAERAPPVPRSKDVPLAVPGPVAQAGSPAPVATESGSAGIGRGSEVTATPQTVKTEPPHVPAAATPPGQTSPGSAAVIPVPGSSAAPGSGWVVQLGSFSRRENADRLAADLGKKGFPAAMIAGQGQGGAVFRVRAGPVGSREEAVSLAARLTAAGYKGQVARQ